MTPHIAQSPLWAFEVDCRCGRQRLLRGVCFTPFRRQRSASATQGCLPCSSWRSRRCGSWRCPASSRTRSCKNRWRTPHICSSLVLSLLSSVDNQHATTDFRGVLLCRCFCVAPPAPAGSQPGAGGAVLRLRGHLPRRVVRGPGHYTGASFDPRPICTLD